MLVGVARALVVGIDVVLDLDQPNTNDRADVLNEIGQIADSGGASSVSHANDRTADHRQHDFLDRNRVGTFDEKELVTAECQKIDRCQRAGSTEVRESLSRRVVRGKHGVSAEIESLGTERRKTNHCMQRPLRKIRGLNATAEIRKSGRKAISVRADVSVAADVDSMIGIVKRELGAPSIEDQPLDPLRHIGERPHPQHAMHVAWGVE